MARTEKNSINEEYLLKDLKEWIEGIDPREVILLFNWLREYSMLNIRGRIFFKYLIKKMLKKEDGKKYG